MASIMFGIPGENSSMVYLRDVAGFDRQQRQRLLIYTANSGLVATVTALIVVMLGHPIMLAVMPILATTAAILIIMALISVMIIVQSGSIWAGALAFVAGAVLAPKSNIALPEIWHAITAWTYDVSVISVMVAVMVLPRLWTSTASKIQPKLDPQPEPTQPWRSTLMGTGWGLIAGFLPGATATIASALAYGHRSGTVADRVISAEAANNSVIIVGAFLLLYLQIPLSLDSMMVSTMFAQQGWNLYTDFVRDIDLPSFVAVLTLATVVIWWLARGSTGVFAWLSRRVDSRWLTVTVAAVMLALDWWQAGFSYSIWAYGIWLVSMTMIGVLWQRQTWNPLPLVFGFVLGDHLIWAIWQTLPQV
jgi:TctA family transporter